jgi:CrcB protein
MRDVSHHRRDLDLFVAVAIGGVIGASARYGIGLLLPSATDQWPVATFLINLTGAFILGVVIEAASALAPDPGASNFARRLRPFFVTGVLGGYTTFSTYMVETHGLVLAGRIPMALLYMFGSLVAGVLLVVLGMALGRRLFARELPAVESASEDDEDTLTEDEG